MSDQIIHSPVFDLQGRAAVAFRGKLMLPSTASRINEYRPHLRRLAEQGLCVPEAARKIGYSIGTIRRWAIILGVSFKKKRRRMCGTSYDKTGWKEVILGQAAVAGTMARAAAIIGVPVSNIHRWCIDNDINWKQLKSDAKKQNR
jgi:hypothetical protein